MIAFRSKDGPSHSPPSNKTALIHVRLDENLADKVKLVADSETEGNVSELVRRLVDRKVEEKLGRVA